RRNTPPGRRPHSGDGLSADARCGGDEGGVGEGGEAEEETEEMEAVD
ncbi:hypothetical protein V502_11051, partial [Pseudogymnoascus sp. VKM F-4520 (FW-2644)]